jgi:hypothetical protein
VLGCAGAGLYGHGAEGRGAALGEDDAVDAGAVGYAEQRAEVLRVFDAVEGEQQAAGAGVCGARRGEKVLDGEELLWANQGDDALVGGGFGQQRELLARLLADADAGLAAERANEAIQAADRRARGRP